MTKDQEIIDNLFTDNFKANRNAFLEVMNHIVIKDEGILCQLYNANHRDHIDFIVDMNQYKELLKSVITDVDSYMKECREMYKDHVGIDVFDFTLAVAMYQMHFRTTILWDQFYYVL